MAEIDTPNVSLSILQLLESVAEQQYVTELKRGCPVAWVLSQEKNFPALFEPSFAIAAKLAQYEQCARELEKLDMTTYVKKVSKNPEARLVVKVFLDPIRSHN
jgi:hypothetical protein